VTGSNRSVELLKANQILAAASGMREKVASSAQCSGGSSAGIGSSIQSSGNWLNASTEGRLVVTPSCQL
jgi:hypothetical protein